MLKFTREQGRTYVADDSSYRYVVAGHTDGWTLTITPLAITAGIVHTVGQTAEVTDSHDTKTLAVAVANAFSATRVSGEWLGRSRYSRAMDAAYRGEY